MILVHTHPSTAYNYTLLCISTFAYLYVCVFVYSFTKFWIWSIALNFGPFTTISVTIYTLASASVYGRGDKSGVCTSCQPMILIKNVQASKTTTSKNNTRKKNQSKIPIGKPHNGTSGES